MNEIFKKLKRGEHLFEDGKKGCLGKQIFRRPKGTESSVSKPQEKVQSRFSEQLEELIVIFRLARLQGGERTMLAGSWVRATAVGFLSWE